MGSDDPGRVSAVFRAAVAEERVPPATFDVTDVVRASRRVTARRRSALAGGALAVLAVAGVGLAAALSAAEEGRSTSAATPADAAADARAESDAAQVPGTLQAAPVGAPLGPGPTGCADRQDPALRVLVEEVLPEVAGAPEAPVTAECRPGGERGVNLEVVDAGAAGLLTVEYLPAGTVPRAPVPGAVSRTAPTASGGTVTVGVSASEPGSPAPFADRVPAVAAYLAPRL